MRSFSTIAGLFSGVVGGGLFLVFFFSIGGILALVNLVAAVAIIFFCAQPTAAGPNPFGPEPPVWAPGPPAAPAAPTS